MQQLPDLSQLSHAQKDALLHALWDMVQKQTAQVAELMAAQQAQSAAQQAQINELQARLKLNSQNSSKPPSSDGLMKPKPKSQRKSGERPVGGPKGHKGGTLLRVSVPDLTVLHEPPAQCDTCHRSLIGLETLTLPETRQVFDLPVTAYQVTEHRVLQTQCGCGKLHRGSFPAEVSAAVQYGPRALAAAVHLSQHHMVPLKRCGQLMGELFGLPISEATILSANAQAASLLKPTVTAIGQAFLSQPVAHADETGLRVGKALHWLHTLATEDLTWVARHAKRGAQAFTDLLILPQFTGTLVHDGWGPYRTLSCVHSLCNAHHLRELTYVHEELKQDWAGDMLSLLRHANHTDNRNCADGQRPDYNAQAYQLELHDLRSLYEAILDQGDALNPRAESTGKPGRVKQSKAANLIQRLRDYSDDVWRFMSDPNVPFTNNLAEQAVRMPKVKQKISGCFRTEAGADIYCTIRSYLATMHKQGANLFDALTQAFRGAPPQPNFG